jgi:spore germination cell wall hydrolase CwlJ-like protein
MRSLALIALTALPVVVGNAELNFCMVRKPTPAKVDPTEHKCLATMVYGEARGEAIQGMVAVAYTAVNRAAKKTVCDVVLAPKQYSIFNNNPALQAAATSLHVEPNQKNVIDRESWERSLKVAQDVLERRVPDPTNGATHYLAPKVMKIKNYRYPKWSKKYELVVVIDNHKFYKEPRKKNVT